MPDSLPLTGSDFYENLPLSDHRAGDIWHGLPTFGMLERTTVAGIVITPACDLANHKTETITYLPIISVAEYLASPACRFECWQEIVKILEKLPEFGAIFTPGRYDLISDDDFLYAISVCKDLKGNPLSKPEIERLDAYKKYINTSRQCVSTIEDVKAVFKADRFNAMLSRLFTNALKTDIHFLPADRQAYGAIAIPVHSVVLFRYPLTIPISLLTRAQHGTEAQWKSGQIELAEHQEVQKQMPKWPVKLASLRNEFLSDLISRYVSVHIRLGSDDFTEKTIKDFCKEI
jgi:hypothetical protein